MLRVSHQPIFQIAAQIRRGDVIADQPATRPVDADVNAFGLHEPQGLAEEFGERDLPDGVLSVLQMGRLDLCHPGGLDQNGTTSLP
jgi:hypothetical protein